LTDPIAALETYQAAVKQHFKRLTADLTAGAISFSVWEVRVETELRALHLFAAQLAVGGVDALMPADRELLARQLDAQLGYFRQFAASMRPPTPTRVPLARLNLYAGAGRATYYRALVAHLGMPELPAVPADGSASCNVSDKCTIEILVLDGDGNWDVLWTRHVDESCPQCVRRAEVWRPLKIRAGVIQPYDSTNLFK
jgi:hypothetical protein